MSKTRTLITLVAVVAMMAVIVPAHATISGNVDFTCEADLPVFPNTNPDVVGTCDGTATGGGSGIADDNEEYAVTGSGTLHAEFSYDETCTLGEPLQGTAEGDVWINGLIAVKGGVEMQADVHAHFTWVRTGTTADITLTNAIIEFSDGTTATAEMDGSAQAAFAPTSVPDCDNPGPITAEVAGTAEFVL